MLFSPNRWQFESILSLFARILETLNVLICIFLWRILRPLFWVTLNELSGVTSYNRHVGFHIKMQISRGKVSHVRQNHIKATISQYLKSVKNSSRLRPQKSWERRIRFPCCPLIQITWWFIWEITIVLFVCIFKSVSCGRLNNCNITCMSWVATKM